MSSWQSGDIEVNGLRLHYTRTGGAKPPIVLAHGFSDDGLCWTPVAEALASKYDVVMVDARGHGRSDGPEQGYGSIEHASDLYGVIGALGLQRAAILGHSMGAATTLTLAGIYPDVPRAILLEDPPAWWMASSEPLPDDAERQSQRRKRIIDIKRKTREELIAKQRAETPGWSEAELGPWADSKLRLSFNVLNSSAVAPVDWTKILRGITCPALLMTADPEFGALVSTESATALRNLVPQLQIAHLLDAGHNIRRDQFDRYIEVVRAFLSNVV